MVGILTNLRPDRKPIVLWTPWGAVPKGGAHVRQAAGRPKLPNAGERLERALAGKDKRRGES